MKDCLRKTVILTREEIMVSWEGNVGSHEGIHSDIITCRKSWVTVGFKGTMQFSERTE